MLIGICRTSRGPDRIGRRSNALTLALRLDAVGDQPRDDPGNCDVPLSQRTMEWCGCPVKDKYFKISITIEPRLGRFREAATVAQAALLLIREWPEERGEKHRLALQACLQVLQGEKPPSFARRAFVAAARQARILASDDANSQ